MKTEVKVKRYRMKMGTRRTLQAYTFMAPFIIGLACFFVFPLLVSVKLSLGTLVNLKGFVIAWSGFQNYVQAFTIDIQFIPMFIKVIISTVSRTPLVLVFSLIIAIMVNKKVRFRGAFRVIYFLPFLLGTGDVMKQLTQQQIDLQVLAAAIPQILPAGLVNFLGAGIVGAITSFFTLIVDSLWSSGVQILLFLSALQGIPQSLYESAKVDGATEWEMFWNITMPMVMPMTQLVVVYTLLDSFMNQNNLVLAYIQTQAFTNAKFAYSAAIGWIYFIFIILVLLVIIGLLNLATRGNDKAEVKRHDAY